MTMSDASSGSASARGPDNYERVARRAVRSVMTLVRRGVALAGGLLIITLVICGGGFALGYAALSDGMQKVWLLIGGFFAVLAIGAGVLAVIRLLSVRAREAQLIEELRRLISGDPRSEQIVIETIETNDAAQDQGVVVMSREFFTMRESLGPRIVDFPALRESLSAVTSLPFLVFITMVVSFVFAFLGLIFGLALLVS
jgi:hypothetical protein